eukprot:6494870-Ditylum_brightwellii.AAC.1
MNGLPINANIAAAAERITIASTSTSSSHNNSQTLSSSHGQGNIQDSINPAMPQRSSTNGCTLSF